MKTWLLVAVGLLSVYSTQAQYTIGISVKNNVTKESLAGAAVSINHLNKKTVTDNAGVAIFSDIPAGRFIISVSYTGMEKQSLAVDVLRADLTLEVLLEPREEEADEVIVTSTRTSRLIRDIPTRVETISGEELSEKVNMKPGDIRMLLNESTGIQTQQTSATSYNSSIRIQGLDGRYTQVLKDGFPLYAGFSGGLSLMQVPPLNLKQVEIIKGSSSTLYGGGAIAGLVNLVTKTPAEKRELGFLANATSASGLDLSGFYSERFNNTGITVFGARNTAIAYDPAGIGLTAIPKYERYTFEPKFFIYGSRTNANIGISYITENRVGGSVDFINRGTPGYFEKNNTGRFTVQADVQHKPGNNSALQFKTAYSNFNRIIDAPAYSFEGIQQSTYTEINYTTRAGSLAWIAGVNLVTDDFGERQHNTATLRNYHNNTIGAFIQNTWTPVNSFALETGLRGDYTNPFGFELLPRISAMLKVSGEFTIRVGGGFGYKTPSVFNEDAEKMQFRNMLPIDRRNTTDERSAGGNLDMNYRTKLGELGIAINQLFFYTRLNRPLVLTQAAFLAFENAQGHIDTRGMETNFRFVYQNFKLFVGYTYADVNNHFNGVRVWSPLSARHRLNNVLVYEREGKLKIGLEAYYVSKQLLNDGFYGKPYWLCGFMAEKMWKRFSLFVNFENIFDTRQTRFDTIFTGPVTSPVFRDIYAPVDGFVINGGLKIRL